MAAASYNQITSSEVSSEGEAVDSQSFKCVRGGGVASLTSDDGDGFDAVNDVQMHAWPVPVLQVPCNTVRYMASSAHM